MRVLLVEPDATFTFSVGQHLVADALQIDAVSTLGRGLSALEPTLPDVVVTELSLPDGDGTTLCRAIRQRPGGDRVGVLFLVAEATEEAAVRAFRAGADDFVAKATLSVRELSLRIRALRRVTRPPPSPSPPLRLGPMRLEVGRRAVWVGHERVALSTVETRLVGVFAARPGKVLTRADLMALVWRGEELQERTVDSAIKRLRARLGAAGQWIETVRGVGYRARSGDVEGTDP